MMIASLLFDDYVILFWFCGDAGACQFAKITAAFVCALLSSFTIS